MKNKLQIDLMHVMNTFGKIHLTFFLAGATSEGVLANFFNSLLSKKTGGPGGGGSPGGVGGTGGVSNLPPSAKKSGNKLFFGKNCVQSFWCRIKHTLFKKEVEITCRFF